MSHQVSGSHPDMRRRLLLRRMQRPVPGVSPHQRRHNVALAATVQAHVTISPLPVAARICQSSKVAGRRQYNGLKHITISGGASGGWHCGAPKLQCSAAALGIFITVCDEALSTQDSVPSATAGDRHLGSLPDDVAPSGTW